MPACLLSVPTYLPTQFDSKYNYNIITTTVQFCSTWYVHLLRISASIYIETIKCVSLCCVLFHLDLSLAYNCQPSQKYGSSSIISTTTGQKILLNEMKIFMLWIKQHEILNTTYVRSAKNRYYIEGYRENCALLLKVLFVCVLYIERYSMHTQVRIN